MEVHLLFVCLEIVVIATSVNAKIRFEKDLDMDAVFPPPVYRQDPGIPEGHFRPLGWQRKSDGPVEEVEGLVSPIEFFHEFVARDTPVVMRKSLTPEAPVFDNWQEDSYLVKQYSQVNVSVRVKTGRKRGKVLSTSQVMTMKKFLSEYQFEELYLSSILPENMMEEIPLPPCIRCGTIRDRLWSAQLWMSSGGTSSRVHSHDDNLLHCVLFGRRDFILIEGHHKKPFDFVPDYSGSMGGHSNMNTEMLDMYQYPQVSRVPWVWATLKQGDCIFVPAGYLHHVRSYGRSISTTIEFSPLREFDDTGCTLDDDEFTPLSKASFHMMMEEGIVRLRSKNIQASELRNILVSLVGKRGGLSMQRFDHFYNALTTDIPGAPPSRKVFSLLNIPEGETELRASDIPNMQDKDLSKMAAVLNSLHKHTDTLTGKVKSRPPKEEF